MESYVVPNGWRKPKWLEGTTSSIHLNCYIKDGVTDLGVNWYSGSWWFVPEGVSWFMTNNYVGPFATIEEAVTYAELIYGHG